MPPILERTQAEKRLFSSPRDETLGRVEPLKLVPEDQAGLLEQVVGVVEVADQGIDVSKKLGLVLAQPCGELGSCVAHRIHGTRHVRPWRIDTRNQNAIRVGFRVRKTSDGRSIITDMQVEGIWLALSERSDFTGFLQQHGGSVAALTDHLRAQADQVRAESAKSSTFG